MTKLFTALLILGLLLGSCSAEEESPEPQKPKTIDTTSTGGGGGNPTPVQPTLTTADPIQFWGLVDGALKTFTAGGGSTQARTGKDSTVGTDSTTTTYVSGMLNMLDPSGILTERGKIKYPNGMIPTEANFMTLFTTGTKTFSPGITGIAYLTSPGGVEWNTSGGSQTGSTYEIIQTTSTGTPTAPKVKIVVKFNCKVYKVTDPSQSKTITNGIMVTEFIAK